MSVRLARLLGSVFIGLLAASSCAVFPDEAVLPGAVAVAGSGGTESAGEGGLAGHSDISPRAGMSSGGTEMTAGSGGDLSTGGSSGGSAFAGAGGALLETGGAGGAGPEPGNCDAPVLTTVPVDIDLWVNAAKDDTNYGKDKLVYVAGGTDARRTMLQFTLPPAPSVGTLLKAELRLHLESNADTTTAARTLGASVLLHDINQTRTTWLHYGKNNELWNAGGGDLVEELAQGTVPAKTVSGTVSMDATVALGKRLTSGPVTLAVVVLEIGPTPSSPAELAFTAWEGNASESATLVLSYCQP